MDAKKVGRSQNLPWNTSIGQQPEEVPKQGPQKSENITDSIDRHSTSVTSEQSRAENSVQPPQIPSSNISLSTPVSHQQAVQQKSGRYLPPSSRIKQTQGWKAPDISLANVNNDSRFVGRLWQTVVVRSRSRSGNDGARFVHLGDNDYIVIKSNQFAVRELAATRLAKLTGLNVPDNVHVELHPTPALLAACTTGPHKSKPLTSPIIAMDIVEGHAFDEDMLKFLIRDDLRTMTPRGYNLVRDIAKVCAFDCLIGNRDRFKILGAVGCNPGNLMLDSDTVVAIDNTLCPPKWVINKDNTEGFQRRLGIVIKEIRKDRLDSFSDSQLSSFMDFFSIEYGVFEKWSAFKRPFVEGFLAQSKAIAAISFEEIDKIISSSGGSTYLGSDTCTFIRKNHDIFKEINQTQVRP